MSEMTRPDLDALEAAHAKATATPHARPDIEWLEKVRGTVPLWKQGHWLEVNGDAIAAYTRALEAEVAALRGKLRPTLFWDADDSENGGNDIADILDNYAPGEMVKIEQACRLPDVYAVRNSGSDEILLFNTEDDALAAAGAT